MSDWLLRMFDTSGFPPRWQCGTWTPFLGWLHIVSDLAIWLSYMGIPAVLYYFVRRRRDLPFLPVFWLFIVFIASCGIGHLVEAGMFWWPAYRFSGAVKLVTALASLATLVALVPFTRRALTLPGTASLLAKLKDESAKHHRNQEELQLSQEQLRMATMASGVGLWSWHAAGDTLTCDANTRAMLGRSAELEMHGRDSLLGCVHPPDREAVMAALQNCIERGAALATTFRVVGEAGAVVHLIARGAPIRDADGRTAGVTGAFFNVTQEEVSRDLFRIALDASPNAMLIVKRSGDITLANAQAESVFGYTQSELIGMSVDLLVPAHVKPGHAALRDGFFAAPSRRKLGDGRELAGMRKDGSDVPLEISLAPVQLAEGPCVLATIVDITERRELHAKLSQAERLAAVGELAAGVAHEINNPVNTMINCAQLTLDGDPAAENCRIIMEEGARIATIVRDLLQFARDDRGKPVPTSLAAVVKRTVSLFGESLKRRGIRLEVEVPAELPPVIAHPQQLQQVLINLLTNAKDALQHDSPREGRRIQVRACTDDKASVRCSVRDNGPGIPPDLRTRIFEPFVTTKRSRGGTGLGLSISKSIVESFGGTIDVRSVLGEFAEFAFVLPQASAHQDHEEHLA